MKHEDEDEGITQELFATMEKNRNHFTIHLHSAQSAVTLSAIQDPDGLMSCDLTEGGDEFLTFAEEKHLEFSTLCRAKFQKNQNLMTKISYRCAGDGAVHDVC